MTITAGSTSGTVTVPDNLGILDELDEIFLVNLSYPTNASIADGHGQETRHRI